MRLLIIVTYRSENNFGRLERVIKDWIDCSSDHVAVVVENSGSTVLKKRLASDARGRQVDVIVSPTNLGFSPAVNFAFRRCASLWGAPDSVVLLNPDVRTDVDTLRAVESRLSESIGIVSPRLVDLHGVLDRGGARRPWTRRTLFAELAGIPRIAPLLGVPPRSIKFKAGQEHVPVGYASGAFMAISSDVFDKGLDETLPMYLEDQEICARAHLMGRDVVIAADLNAMHIGGESRMANSEAQRGLRLMELVAAPAIMLSRIPTAASWRSIRIAVGAGALTRASLTLLLSPVMLTRPSRRSWYRSQLTMSRWFAYWAFTSRGVEKPLGSKVPQVLGGHSVLSRDEA